MSSTTNTAAETAQILQVSEQLYPLFQGLPSNVQGGVLARMLAKWLADHEMVDDVAGTLSFQDHLMRAHFQLIMQLMFAAQHEKGWR